MNIVNGSNISNRNSLKIVDADQVGLNDKIVNKKAPVMLAARILENQQQKKRITTGVNEDEIMHAVEDFENFDNVINVQIGAAGSQDLFFN